MWLCGLGTNLKNYVMKSKQTAVEWLAKELLREHPIQTNHDIIQQAKAMEKEQICNAYVYGAAYGIDVLNKLIPDTYYNETFKSE